MNLSLKDLRPRIAKRQLELTGFDIKRNIRWDVLSLLVVVWLSFSCRQGNVEQQDLLTTYGVDTVLIESKGRILDVAGYMQASDISDNGASFYLFNRHDFSIDEINLEQKAFARTYPLEAEGPNGVGQFIFGLQVLGDSLMFLKSVPFSSIIDENGHVVQKVDWLAAKDTNGVQLNIAPPRMEAVVNYKDWRVVGTNLDFLKKTAFMGVFSLDQNQVTNVDIDPERSFPNYFLSVDNNFRDPWVYLHADERFIYVSHTYSNEIILLNPEGEMVKVVHYEPKLTPRRANYPEVSTGTREQINREERKLLEQVSFQAPVWDSVNKRYFRLSAKRNFGNGTDSAAAPGTHVFLSLFDEAFNLVSEIELKELNSVHFKNFAKDGKLWVSQSFSDELGFLVFDFR